MNWYVTAQMPENPPTDFEQIVSQGDLNAAREFISNLKQVEYYYFDPALEEGQFEIAQMLFDHPKGISRITVQELSNALTRAVRKGKRDIVSFLLQNGVKPNQYLMADAIRNYRSDKGFLDYAISIGAPVGASSWDDLTRHSKGYEIVSKLKDAGYKADAQLHLTGVINDDNVRIDIIRLLLDMGATVNPNVMKMALMTDNIELVKLLLSYGMIPTPDAIALAIIEGHTEIAQLFRQVVPKEEPQTLIEAVKTNNSEVVYKALERGVTTDKGIPARSLNFAIENRNEEIVDVLLNYFGQNGITIPNPYALLKKAFWGSSTDVCVRLVNYFGKIGQKIETEDGNLLSLAMGRSKGAAEVMEALIQNGFSSLNPKILHLAVSRSRLDKSPEIVEMVLDLIEEKQYTGSYTEAQLDAPFFGPEIYKRVLNATKGTHPHVLCDEILLRSPEMVKALLEHGLDSKQDRCWGTVSNTSNLEVAKLLFPYGKERLNPDSIFYYSGLDGFMEYAKNVENPQLGDSGLQHLAKSGNPELARAMLPFYKKEINRYAVETAVKSGDLEFLKLFLDRVDRFSEYDSNAVLELAIKEKNLEKVNEILKKSEGDLKESMERAVSTKQPDMVDLILKKFPSTIIPRASILWTYGLFPHIYKNHREKVYNTLKQTAYYSYEYDAKKTFKRLQKKYDFSLEAKKTLAEDFALVDSLAPTIRELYLSGEVDLDKLEIDFSNLERINGNEIGRRFNAANDLSEYTGKRHYDYKELMGSLNKLYEIFKKDHNLSFSPILDRLISNIVINQLNLTKDINVILTVFQKFNTFGKKMDEALQDKNVSKYIGSYLLSSSKSTDLGGENPIIYYASIIPQYLESQYSQLEKEGMEEIDKKYPKSENREENQKRWTAIKRMRNEIKNNVKIPINTTALHRFSVQLDKHKYADYNKFLDDIEKGRSTYTTEEQKDFSIKGMEQIVFYSDANFYEALDGVGNIINHENFGKSEIDPIKISVDVDGDAYEFASLDKTDPLGLVLGELAYSGCCQKFEDASESSMIEGYVNPKSGFLTVYKDGKFQAQSWMWLTEDGESLVLDNVEFSSVLKRKSDELEGGERGKKNIFADVFQDRPFEGKGKKMSKNQTAKQKIQQAYKKFAQKYKEATGRSVLIGTGYDSLGVDRLGEKVPDWDNDDKYPFLEEGYQDLYLQDSKEVVKVAKNWYQMAKYAVSLIDLPEAVRRNREHSRRMEELDRINFEHYEDDHADPEAYLYNDMIQPGSTGTGLMDNDELQGYLYGYDFIETDNLEDFDPYEIEFMNPAYAENFEEFLEEFFKKIQQGKVMYVSNLAVQKQYRRNLSLMINDFLKQLREKGYEFLAAEMLSDSYRLLMNPDGSPRSNRLDKYGLDFIGQIMEEDEDPKYAVLFKIL